MDQSTVLPTAARGRSEHLSQVPPQSLSLQEPRLPGGKSPSLLHKALYDLPPSPPCLYLLPLSVSLTLLQPHGPPHCLSNTPGTVLPQGLCTGCFLCWKAVPSESYMAPSLTSLGFLLKCLCNETLIFTLIKNCKFHPMHRAWSRLPSHPPAKSLGFRTWDSLNSAPLLGGLECPGLPMTLSSAWPVPSLLCPLPPGAQKFARHTDARREN